mmetsp:Transcript_27367/g.66559  ORF Transcript_27367/g.66559 Transcript_27367/m.66559 type:complete len:121 (+) Transcript_27367:1434-1796(+)
MLVEEASDVASAGETGGGLEVEFSVITEAVVSRRAVWFWSAAVDEGTVILGATHEATRLHRKREGAEAAGDGHQAPPPSAGKDGMLAVTLQPAARCGAVWCGEYGVETVAPIRDQARRGG